MNIFKLSCILVIITNFGISFLALWRGKTNSSARIFSGVSISSGIWGLAGLMISSIPASQYDMALFWWQWGYVGAIFTVVFYSHFVVRYLNKKRTTFITIVYLLGFVFLALNWHDKSRLFLGDLQFIFNEFYWVDWIKRKNATWLVFYISFLWLILGYSFLLLVAAYRKSRGIFRNQLRYLILGSAVGWLGTEPFYLPPLHINIYPLSNFLISIYPLIFIYAIIKYRLMDIKIALTRAGIFIIVYLLVLGIPLGLTGWGKPWLQGLFGTNWYWVPLILAIILATAGPFIFIFLSRRAEARLLAEERRGHKVLLQASVGMMRFRGLKKLINLIVHVTCKTLRLENASMFLLDENSSQYKLGTVRLKSRYKYLESLAKEDPLIKRLSIIDEPLVYEEVKQKAQQLKDNPKDPIHEIESQMAKLFAAVIVPAVSRGRLLGFLVLGEKRSRRMYSKDDLDTLWALSYQAALAIENALFWASEEERLVESSQEEAVSAVTFGAGHQFNNRLYAISMTTDYLLETLKSKDTAQLSHEEQKALLQKVTTKLKRISEECQFGGQITAGIMGLTGRTPPNFSEFDLALVITSSLELVQMKHSQDKVEDNRPPVNISCHIDENLPKAFGSDAQIRDCIFNLVDNSFDAIYKKDKEIKSGEPEFNWSKAQAYLPHIEIKAYSKDNQIILEVTDNGIGIKEEDKKRLFAGYFTTKATGVKGYGKGGHGIGLFTVKKLIFAHKGKLYFTSEYGQGTTFTIELPLEQKEKEGKVNA